MIIGAHQFHLFLTHKNLLHGVSSKTSGSMKNANELQINRSALATFAKSVGITGDIVCMKQIHSGTVSVIENTKVLQIPESDALVTNKKHVPLGVLTADCLPILFYDPKKAIIAVAHAGYKGLLNHIIEHTVSCLVTRFQSNPKDILICMGPGIEMSCYEVGKDRIYQFTKTFPMFKNIFIKKERKYYLNLVSVAQQCLIKQGILKEHIENMNVCTKCDPNFYSYRGGDKEERFVSVISLI